MTLLHAIQTLEVKTVSDGQVLYQCDRIFLSKHVLVRRIKHPEFYLVEVMASNNDWKSKVGFQINYDSSEEDP